MKGKRIPTILGTLLLLVLLFVGVWLSLQKTNLFTKASGDCTPTGVQTTNLTNKSVDISFITTSSCSSTININTKTIANFKTKSTTHYFRVDNLSASTQYQYYFIIDGVDYRQTSYSFKTARLPSGNLPTANLAWGKVISPSGQATPNAIVYLNIIGAWPLSALTDSNGQWHISLSNSFTDDQSSLFTPPPTGTEDILVYSEDGTLTQVENSLTQNDPVPNIITGLGLDSGLGAGPGSTVAPTQSALQTPTSVILNSKLSISSPAEGESITALKPDIFGTGKNNSLVNLSIDTVITGTTNSRTDGTWNWSPPTNLALGKHILTVTLGNELLQRNFTVVSVVPSSSPLSFSATPSATIVPSATPTILPTLVPTIRTAKVSTKSGVPVTGNTNPFYFLILSSLLAVIFSLYFFHQNEK